MDAARILQQFETHGVTLRVDGEAVFLRPRGVAPPELVKEARQNKADLVALLSSSLSRREPAPAAEDPERVDWPAECLEAERRFGVPQARLYPLIGLTVHVVDYGLARLVQVLGQTAAVVPPRSVGKVDFVECSRVSPECSEAE